MEYTSNYQLPTWVETDRIQMDDFNDMTDKIDAALGEQSETLAEHTAAIAELGNCAVYTSSYTGTGTYGEGNPNTLTFPDKPVLVLVVGGSSLGVSTYGSGGLINLRSGNSFYCDATWSADGKTLSWYGSNDLPQMNSRNENYRVVSIIAL